MEKQKIQWALFHRKIKTAEQKRKKRQWSACKYSRTSSLLAARDVSWERNFSSDKERGETAVFEWGTETFSQNLSQNSRVESLILDNVCACPTVHAPQSKFSSIPDQEPYFWVYQSFQIIFCSCINVSLINCWGFLVFEFLVSRNNFKCLCWLISIQKSLRTCPGVFKLYRYVPGIGHDFRGLEKECPFCWFFKGYLRAQGLEWLWENWIACWARTIEPLLYKCPFDFLFLKFRSNLRPFVAHTYPRGTPYYGLYEEAPLGNR